MATKRCAGLELEIELQEARSAHERDLERSTAELAEAVRLLEIEQGISADMEKMVQVQQNLAHLTIASTRIALASLTLLSSPHLSYWRTRGLPTLRSARKK